jgi:hypothetical protein
MYEYIKYVLNEMKCPKYFLFNDSAIVTQLSFR